MNSILRGCLQWCDVVCFVENGSFSYSFRKNSLKVSLTQKINFETKFNFLLITHQKRRKGRHFFLKFHYYFKENVLNLEDILTFLTLIKMGYSLFDEKKWTVLLRTAHFYYY